MVTLRLKGNAKKVLTSQEFLIICRKQFMTAISTLRASILQKPTSQEAYINNPICLFLTGVEMALALHVQMRPNDSSGLLVK